MKLLILTLVSVFLFGCVQVPIRTSTSSNPNVPVDLLLQYDGCKVYRFQDYGDTHYFVKCSDPKSSMTDGRNKSSRDEVIITTSNK